MPLSIKKLPKSAVEIESEIPADEFERHYKDALKEMGEKSSIPGFRPGHIPENVLIEKIGEGAILEHAAEHTLREHYSKILKEHEIDAIGNPQITITKIARKNPLGFKIQTAVLPEIKLPDYKNIVGNIIKIKEEIKVEDKEIDEAVEYLRKTKSESDFQKTERSVPRSSKQEEDKKNKEAVLPELNDEFAKGFGQPDVASLKNLLKNNILQDKEIKAREKKRMEIMNKISSSVDLEIPEILIQSEKEKMTAELRSSIENMTMKWEDYLKHIKKTEDDLKNDWTQEAEKRARYALILRAIANLEKIEPSNDELNNFVEKTVGQYPETERKKIDKNRLKDYAYGIIRNEKVFQFLESQK